MNTIPATAHRCPCHEWTTFSYISPSQIVPMTMNTWNNFPHSTQIFSINFSRAPMNTLSFYLYSHVDGELKLYSWKHLLSIECRRLNFWVWKKILWKLIDENCPIYSESLRVSIFMFAKLIKRKLLNKLIKLVNSWRSEDVYGKNFNSDARIWSVYIIFINLLRKSN